MTINFGHELMTSVHTPLEWSDRRPTVAQVGPSEALVFRGRDLGSRAMNESLRAV